MNFIKTKPLYIIIPLLLVLIILASIFLLPKLGKKDDASKITPTPTPRGFTLTAEEMPYASIIASADGHYLTLKLEKIPDFISKIEYDLTYTAVDEGLEIEKGVGGNIDEIQNNSFEREVLLGTESCTSGCKYKYDTGVNGGILYLTLISSSNQVTSLELPYTLSTSADIKTDGISVADFTIMATPADSAYYVLLQNPNQTYSLFSSSTGKGKLISTEPQAEKEDNGLLTGDYIIQ